MTKFGAVLTPKEWDVYRSPTIKELCTSKGVRTSMVLENYKHHTPSKKLLSPRGGKTNIQIEQVGKGGLPPLLPHLSGRETAGVNHPSRLVQFVVSTCYLLGLYKQSNS